MRTATFAFFGRLNDFLAPDQRNQVVGVEFRGRQTLKHLAESLGVPHPEIGQVQVNGQERTLDTVTEDGDRVEIHPVPNAPPSEPRFILDGHLGRLAAYLRMLGFDCLYENDYNDEELADLARIGFTSVSFKFSDMKNPTLGCEAAVTGSWLGIRQPAADLKQG